MSRSIARVRPLLSGSFPVSSLPAIRVALGWRPVDAPTLSFTFFATSHLQILSSCFQIRSFHISRPFMRDSGLFSAIFFNIRNFRKVKRWKPARKQAPKKKKLELSVKISIEECISNDHEIVNIAEMLKLDAPMAMKKAFDCLKELEWVQVSVTEDISKYEKIELTLLLCTNDLITKSNKECKGIYCVTDVLSIVQHAQEHEIPNLILGDIVISVEAAAREAQERGHTLQDEIRNLMIRGLLQLLFYNYSGDETPAEMEKLEELVLGSLGWKGRG